MYRGTDFVHKLTIQDQSGSAINLTGFTGDKITYTLQASAYDTTNQIHKEIGSGITLSDAANGKADVTISAADTADFEFSGADLTYTQSVEVEVSSKRDVCATGVMTIKQRPSKVTNISIGGDSTGKSPVAAASFPLAYELPTMTLNIS
tara:strand:+ start:6375 stop:6821 length:447 start_codon:yes stop_codon:yes gene_type:complete